MSDWPGVGFASDAQLVTHIQHPYDTDSHVTAARETVAGVQADCPVLRGSVRLVWVSVRHRRALELGSLRFPVPRDLFRAVAVTVPAWGCSRSAPVLALIFHVVLRPAEGASLLGRHLGLAVFSVRLLSQYLQTPHIY